MHSKLVALMTNKVFMMHKASLIFTTKITNIDLRSYYTFEIVVSSAQLIYRMKNNFYLYKNFN